MEWLDNVKYAKMVCAKNKRCVGIEVRDYLFVGICMDAVCTSRALNNNENSTIIFHKKKERYGKMKKYDTLDTPFGNLFEHSSIMSICRIAFIAFPDDFIKLKNADRCNEYGNEDSKSANCSDTEQSLMLGQSLLQTECELNCSLKDGCLGCAKVCHNLCRWNEIMDYEPRDYFENASVRTVTKKTGKISRKL